MLKNIIQHLYHLPGETKVAIVAAGIAMYSAHIALKANRLSILPVLVLDISDSTSNIKAHLRNIGVGVAHRVTIKPVRLLYNRRTPHRNVSKVVMKHPGKNYIQPGEEQELDYGEGHRSTWYLKASKEGKISLPIMYSDSMGTRYITILRLGNGRIDITLSPRKFSFQRRVRYLARFIIWPVVAWIIFRITPADKSLRVPKNPLGQT